MATERETNRSADRTATGRPERGPGEAGAAVHAHRRFSWLVVVTICAAAIVLAFAFVLHSLALAIVGAVLGVLGVIGLIAGGVMEDAY